MISKKSVHKQQTKLVSCFGVVRSVLAQPNGCDFQDFQVFQLNHGPKLSAFQDSAWPILFLGQKSNSRLRVVRLNLPEPNLQPEIFKISKL